MLFLPCELQSNPKAPLSDRTNQHHAQHRPAKQSLSPPAQRKRWRGEQKIEHEAVPKEFASALPSPRSRKPAKKHTHSPQVFAPEAAPPAVSKRREPPTTTPTKQGRGAKPRKSSSRSPPQSPHISMLNLSNIVPASPLDTSLFSTGRPSIGPIPSPSIAFDISSHDDAGLRPPPSRLSRKSLGLSKRASTSNSGKTKQRQSLSSQAAPQSAPSMSLVPWKEQTQSRKSISAVLPTTARATDEYVMA